jgi:hypothetical protein
MAIYHMNKVDSNYQIINSSLTVIKSNTSSSNTFNYLVGNGGVATNGDILYVDSGAYSVESTWEVYISGVTIIFSSGLNTQYGAGTPGSVLTAIYHSNPNNVSNVIMWIYANNVSISGITVDGNGINQLPTPTTLITDGNYNIGIINQGNNCEIKNSTIYNIRTFGITFTIGSTNSGVVSCKVYNCGTNGIQDGLGAHICYSSYFVNNEVYGCSDVGVDSFAGSTNDIITGNYVHDTSPVTCPMYGYANSYWGIGGEWGGGTGSGSYSLISNNIVTNVQNFGIFICNSGGSGSCDYNLVSGNIITNSWNGIRISNCSSASYNRIESNNIINSGGIGVSLDSSAHYTNVYGNTYSGCAVNYDYGSSTNTTTSAPTVVALTVTSSPLEAGYITVNGVTPTYLPYSTYATVGGSSIIISASNPSGYVFSSWSDSGSQSHSITIPSVYTVYTASYVSGESAALPWSDTFTNLNNWTTQNGTWSVASNTLTGTSSIDALIVAGNITWTDYTVTLIGMVNTISDQRNVDIVFRFTDTNNFYFAGIGGWGSQYEISKMLSGTPSQLVGYGTVSSISINTPYTIRVSAISNTITLYVNSNQVLQTTDSSFSSGEIGIRAYNDIAKVSSVSAVSGYGFVTISKIISLLAKSKITAFVLRRIIYGIRSKPYRNLREMHTNKSRIPLIFRTINRGRINLSTKINSRYKLKDNVIDRLSMVNDNYAKVNSLIRSLYSNGIRITKTIRGIFNLKSYRYNKLTYILNIKNTIFTNRIFVSKSINNISKSIRSLNSIIAQINNTLSYKNRVIQKWVLMKLIELKSSSISQINTIQLLLSNVRNNLYTKYTYINNVMAYRNTIKSIISTIKSNINNRFTSLLNNKTFIYNSNKIINTLKMNVNPLFVYRHNSKSRVNKHIKIKQNTKVIYVNVIEVILLRNKYTAWIVEEYEKIKEYLLRR